MGMAHFLRNASSIGYCLAKYFKGVNNLSGGQSLYKMGCSSECPENVLTGWGLLKEPRLVSLAITDAGYSRSRHVNTPSVGTKMVSLSLGVISADCTSSCTNSSKRHMVHSTSSVECAVQLQPQRNQRWTLEETEREHTWDPCILTQLTWLSFFPKV